MNSDDAVYLYTLAALSVSFVGFTAILVVFRQVKGGRMTRFDSFVTRTFLFLGLLVTIGAMLPSLLAIWRLPEPLIWRIASIVMGIVFLAYVAIYPALRRAAINVALPVPAKVVLGLRLVAALMLVVNTAGIGIQPGLPLYASALSLLFVTNCLALIHALGVLLQQPTDT
jgi:hypothetical protein